MKKQQSIFKNIDLWADVCQPLRASSSTSSQVSVPLPAEEHTHSHGTQCWNFEYAETLVDTALELMCLNQNSGWCMFDGW